jgi:hypothetical protein
MFVPGMMRPQPAQRKSASSGHQSVDAAAAKRGWLGIDRGREIAYQRAGAKDVIVTKRLLELPVMRERIVGQLERG